MTVYILAQLKFINREVYDRYQARFMSVFRQFDGQLLAADEQPQVLEGCWDREKIVLMSFPDQESSERFLNSAAYGEITVDRRAGADTVVLSVKGFPSRP